MSTYKFGAYDLNLENYIKTLRTNINTYLEQDPDTENWSRKDRERFVEAYNQYISGLQNQLDTGNVNFQTGDTGSLHDMYGVFTNEKAARRVASYANKMGQETVKKLNSKQEPQQEKIPTFEDYVKTTYNVDKSWNELDYLAKDEEEDENGVRGIKKRSDFLQKAINDYKSKYTDSPYNVELTNLYNALNNGFNTEAITAANKAGLTEEFYRSLFETKYDKSLETIKKEREAKQKQEQQQAVTDKYNTWLSEQDALYNTNINGKTSLVINNDYLDKYPDVYKDGKFDARAARKAIIDKYSAENPSDSNLQENKLFKKAIFSYLDQLMRGESTGIDKIVLDLFDYGKGFDKVKFNGEEYWLLNIDPYYSDLYNQNLFFGYNKTDGTVGYGHLEWWTTKWSEKVNEWKQQNSGDRAKPALTFKQGGEVFKFQNSGKVIRRGKTINFDELFEEDRKKSIEKQAKENNVSVKQQEYWESKPFENGLDDLDWQTKAQLGSLGADIASMAAAFFPGYGTIASGVLGLGSTAANAAVDFTTGDDYQQDTKNLLTNLAFDTLGLIPGTGSASKVGKVVNVVRKLSPLLLGYQTWSALTNGEQYVNAFKKLMESPKDMTQQDFLTALNGIRLLTGWATFGAGKLAQNQSEKTARKSLGNKDTDIIGVPVHDETKGTYVEVFRGKKARDIRTAIESGDIKQVENVVGKPVDYGTHPSIDLKWHFIPTGRSSKLNKPYPLEVFAFNDKYKVNVPGIFNHWNYIGKKGEIDVSKVLDEIAEYHLNTHADYDTKSSNLESRLKELRNKAKTTKTSEELKTIQNSKEFKTNSTKLEKVKTKINSLSSKSSRTQVEEVELRNLKEEQAKLEQYFKDFGVNAQPGNPEEITKQILSLEKQKSKLKKPTYTEEELDRTFFLGSDKITLKDILEKYEIPYEKQGGTLDRVRKFQSGGQTWRKKPNYLNIEDIESNANNINTWDSYYKTNDIYSDLKKNPLQIDSKVFLDTVNQLNDLNLDFTKEINKKGFGAWNTLFDNLGLNSRYFGSDSAKFDYLGPTTYNRNVILQGLKDIYTKESPLKTTDNKNIYHDGNKWISEDIPTTWKHPYLDGIHERYGNDQKPLMVNDQKSWMPFGITGKELAIQEDSKEKSETYDPFEEKFKEKRFNIFDKLFKENTLLTHALPRAFYADKVNKKLRDMAIANEKAYLKDPFQYNRYVTGDLGRLAYGDKQAGELYSWANTATNSDASLQTAKSLDARLKALDAKYQAFNEDNQAIKTSMEQAWSQQKENALNAHQTAQDNMKSLLQSDANKNVYNMAYENKKHETFDTLWQQFEHLTQRKLNEIKNYQKQFDDFYMGSYVDNNLGKLNPNLSPEAVAIYQNVRNGSKKRSELTADEEQLFKLAVNAADQTKYRIAGERYGFKPSFISKSKIDPNFVIHVKNGGSIKERIANAERLYKTIKDKHDENEKKLNRLFKSLYTLKNKNK